MILEFLNKQDISNLIMRLASPSLNDLFGVCWSQTITDLEVMNDGPVARFVCWSNSKPFQIRGPRHCRSVKINPDKLEQEERYLPPGTMRDVWEQMSAVDKDAKVSFAQFWRVWKSEYPHLKFRTASSHALCSVCLRHKLLIKEMGHHLRARKAQRELFNTHLQRQYADRQEYWRKRAASRLHSTEILMIVDSMDQAKFTYPRGNVYRSKDLATLQRPRAHITGIICHGYFVLFSVSGQDLPKDSTTMVELISHALTILQKKVDLRKCAVTIQCDNTPRELKNNPMCKYLSYLVCNNILFASALSSLRTGHSHEDIDQVFGQLAKHLATKCRSANTPADFQVAIQHWMSTSFHRPYEPGKYCVHLDQTRNWILGWLAIIVQHCLCF